MQREIGEGDRRNQYENIRKIIKDKEHVLSITAAVCDECGGEMSHPGLINKNIQEVEEQYSIEGIVTSME